jgi:hypothetical protein
MSNTIALEFLANSREFDEKWKTIEDLTKILGSFILRSFPIATLPINTWDTKPFLKRQLPSQFGKASIIIHAWEQERRGIVVGFKFKTPDNGDPVIWRGSYTLEIVRYLYDNLDIFVEMAEECCQKQPGAFDKFKEQMARFGM